MLELHDRKFKTIISMLKKNLLKKMDNMQTYQHCGYRRITELEDGNYPNQNTKKKKRREEQSIQELWGNIKQSNTSNW